MEDKIGVMYLGVKENARGHWQTITRSHQKHATEAYSWILDLWPLELWKNKISVVLNHQVCYRSPKKGMYFCNSESESVSNSKKPKFWIAQFEHNRAKFHLGNVLKQPLLWSMSNGWKCGQVVNPLNEGSLPSVQTIILLWWWMCSFAQSRPLFAIPRTVAHQAPLSLEFSRQQHWATLPFPSPWGLPDPGIKPRSLAL